MTATPTTQTITISYHTGNLLCGLTADQTSGLDFAATLDSYEAQVRTALAPEYDVTFERLTGEGPAERIEGADGEEDYVLNEISSVFNDGYFWTFEK